MSECECVLSPKSALFRFRDYGDDDYYDSYDYEFYDVVDDDDQCDNDFLPYYFVLL